MKEIDLQREVLAIAGRLHLLAFHCRDSRSSLGSGFPDLVIAGPHGAIFAELKGARGSLTPDQRHWASMLQKGGELWTVWRPSDLKSGAIETMLKTLATHEQLALAVPGETR